MVCHELSPCSFLRTSQRLSLALIRQGWVAVLMREIDRCSWRSHPLPLPGQNVRYRVNETQRLSGRAGRDKRLRQGRCSRSYPKQSGWGVDIGGNTPAIADIGVDWCHSYKTALVESPRFRGDRGKVDPCSRYQG